MLHLQGAGTHNAEAHDACRTQSCILAVPLDEADQLELLDFYESRSGNDAYAASAVAARIRASPPRPCASSRCVWEVSNTGQGYRPAHLLVSTGAFGVANTAEKGFASYVSGIIDAVCPADVLASIASSVDGASYMCHPICPGDIPASKMKLFVTLGSQQPSHNAPFVHCPVSQSATLASAVGNTVTSV